MPRSKSELAEFDISTKVGPLLTDPIPPEWPMYSFTRPSWLLWNAIGKGLYAKRLDHESHPAMAAIRMDT